MSGAIGRVPARLDDLWARTRNPRSQVGRSPGVTFLVFRAMRRNPSPEVGRSETTAELIARISAERDAPLRSTGRHAVITAPPRTTAAAAPAPQIRRPRRPAADREVSPHTDPRMRAYRPVRDDEPSELRTGPIDLRGVAGYVPDPRPSAPQRRVDTGYEPGPDLPRPRREHAPAVVDDVLHDPDAGAIPVFVAPDAPAPRRPLRLAVSAALVAVAMVVVGSAAAGWFGGTGADTAPADIGAVTAPVGGVGVVPEPAATGPTVPAPVDGAPAEAAPEAPADDVQLTGGAVPPPDSSGSYGY